MSDDNKRIRFAQIQQHLTEHDIDFVTDNEAAFKAFIWVKRALCQVDIQLCEKSVAVDVWAPVIVPDGAVPAIDEAIHRINRTVIYGKLIRNPNDNTIAFENSVKYEDFNFSGDSIHKLIAMGLSVMSDQFVVFASVIFCNTSAEEAVTQTERWLSRRQGVPDDD